MSPNISDDFKVYSSRWMVLVTLCLANVSINGNWISFAPVATKVAAFFEVETSGVDLFLSVGYLAGLTVALAATWLVERLGLK